MENSQIISEFIKNSHSKKQDAAKPLALFDLDKTILKGDISDAFFALLLKNKININYTWENYLDDFLQKGENIAYENLAKSFAGLSPSAIDKLVLKMLNSEQQEFRFSSGGEEVIIEVPKIRHSMLNVIDECNQNGLEVVIISASHEVLVGAVIKNFLAGKISAYYGIKTANQGEMLGSHILDIVPFRNGKKEIYKKHYTGRQVLLSAGDSINDVDMLNLTDDDGMILLIQENNGIFEQIKSEIYSEAKVVRLVD